MMFNLPKTCCLDFLVIRLFQLCAIVYTNLPASITIGAATPTVDFLSNAKLIRTDDEKDVLGGKQIQGKDLFDNGPTLIMAVRRP
uniref:Uncharacterized protein n=1 Tax=Panagrolaimus sp. PS1159 TaxID=55785 RepID=A0AC35FFJ0_9BILA